VLWKLAAECFETSKYSHPSRKLAKLFRCMENSEGRSKLANANRSSGFILPPFVLAESGSGRDLLGSPSSPRSSVGTPGGRLSWPSPGSFLGSPSSSSSFLGKSPFTGENKSPPSYRKSSKSVLLTPGDDMSTDASLSRAKSPKSPSRTAALSFNRSIREIVRSPSEISPQGSTLELGSDHNDTNVSSRKPSPSHLSSATEISSKPRSNSPKADKRPSSANTSRGRAPVSGKDAKGAVSSPQRKNSNNLFKSAVISQLSKDK
jgi:hypothetical protein